MGLKQVAVAGAFAFASAFSLAAAGDKVAKDVRTGANPAKSPSAAFAAGGGSSTTILAGLQPVVAGGVPVQLVDVRLTAVDPRGTPAGRPIQGAGLMAAAPATAQSLMAAPGGQNSAISAEPSAAGEMIDTGALVLSSLGVMGLLALRRMAGS